MRVNEETVLLGDKVVLVPYRKQHVERYHQWMSDEQIRAQTASEPLSLKEEYDMQRSWHTDDDKLTFIVLARGQQQKDVRDDTDALQHVLATSDMAGDVNLFISQRHDDADDEEDNNVQPTLSTTALAYDAELEVMIAEPAHRRRGLAREAISLLMHYASTQPTPAPIDATSLAPARYLPLPVSSFVAKIGVENGASNALFEQLGFREVKRSEVWQEMELRPDAGKTLRVQAPSAVLRWPCSDGASDESNKTLEAS